MTIHTDELPKTPLTTERDMTLRIRDLLAPAGHPAQLWTLLLDEAGYQSPVLIPLEDRPRLPDTSLVDGLATALRTVVDETLGGLGQALFVVERLGPFGVTHEDRCWAAALTGACERHSLAVAGTFLLSPGGVSALRG